MLRSGAWKFPFKLGLKFLRRSGEISKISRQLHETHAPGPHSYVFLLGVDPAEQGKGFGGQLLKALLDKLDAEQRGCYLETAKEANLSFYQHFGFEVKEAVELKDLELIIWALARKPGSGDIGTHTG
jgi:GNAT superfamily N-acetyltransferase